MSENDDLQDELLALVGESNSDPRKRRVTKRKRKRSYESDSDSDFVVDDEEEEEPEEEIEWDDSWGDDYMGDDKERRRLMEMSQLDREQIIAERKEKRQAILERKKLQAIVKNSDRSFGKKNQRLNELANKRGVKKRRTEDEFIYEEIKEEPQRPVELVDIRNIQITRDQLKDWSYCPFFERTAIGCFVRLYLGDNDGRAVYRLCRIEDVEEYKKSYYVDKVLMKTGLKLSHGESSKVWPIENVSNSAVREEEFIRYQKTMDTQNCTMIDVDEVEDKQADLKKAKNYVLSDKEINAIVARRKELLKKVTNIAVERQALNRRKEKAIAENDAEELEKVNEALVELEELTKEREKNTDTGLSRMYELNKRNKKINLEEIRQAENLALLEKRKKGNSALDPFARLKCNPTRTDVVAKVKTVTDAAPTPERTSPIKEEKVTPMHLSAKMAQVLDQIDIDIDV